MSASPAVLAIDTTSDWCSVALLRAGACDWRSERAGHDHSRLALPMARELLDAAAIAPRELDAVAFGAGPGSFTGLRIACGLAQGLAYGLGVPTVAIGSLESLAWAALTREAAGTPRALTAIDARMDEVYFAAYRLDDDGDVAAVIGPALAAPEPVAVALTDWLAAQPGAGRIAVACGDAFDRVPALHALTSSPRLLTLPSRHPRADAVARIASLRLARGGGVPASQARPVYLRDKVALDVDEQAALRARRTAKT